MDYDKIDESEANVDSLPEINADVDIGQEVIEETID